MTALGHVAAHGLTDVDVGALARRYAGTFPWYAALVGPSDADAVPLSRLPVIDTDLLDRHYFGAGADLDGGTTLPSSTTGGRTRAVRYSPGDRESYVAQRKRLFEWFLAGLPAETTVVDVGAGPVVAPAARIFTELGLRCHDLDATRPVADQVARLNGWRPDVLSTTPATLDRLWRAHEPLAIAPRKIILAGAAAQPAWRRRVADRFGIGFGDVLDVLDSIEIGAIAYYCAETDLYHFHDHIVPEVLAPPGISAGRDAEPGPRGWERGVLILTSFAREYFPALRFLTRDMVSGLRTVRWRNRTVRAFERIEGPAGPAGGGGPAR